MHNMIMVFVDKDVLRLALCSLKAAGMLLLISVGGDGPAAFNSCFIAGNILPCLLLIASLKPEKTLFNRY